MAIKRRLIDKEGRKKYSLDFSKGNADTCNPEREECYIPSFTEMIMGRSKESDVQIDENKFPYVSGEHLKFYQNPENKESVLVQDLDSTNGTAYQRDGEVNEVPSKTSGKSLEAKAGDLFILGARSQTPYIVQYTEEETRY